MNAGNRAIMTMTSPRYWPGTYVLAKMLRHYGCEVPLYVYTTDKDKLPPAMLSLRRTIFLPSSHKSAKDCETMRLEHLLSRPEREIFYLGSDTYPVKDLTPHFDELKSHPCLLWEDIPDGDKFIPSQYGLPDESKLTSFQPQGDTMLFDMEKCRPALEKTRELVLKNLPGTCGDQTAFRAAWLLEGLEQHRYGTTPVDWTSVEQVFLHRDAGGQVLIVHRVGSKWPLTFGSPLVYNRDIPEEPEAWHYYRQINEAMR